MEQLLSRAVTKNVEPSVFCRAQLNPFSKHAESSLAGIANSVKPDYSPCKHLVLKRLSLSGRLQTTRALSSRTGCIEHLMRTGCKDFEDNADKNGASLDTSNKDHMILTVTNADGSSNNEGSTNCFSKEQGAASHVKHAFEDFRSKLDLHNFNNRDLEREVYLNGKYYNMRDESFIKLRNSNFLKFSSKALCEKYKIDERSFVDSLNQPQEFGPVVFESDNDFYRQADFNTNEELQQKLTSLGGMD